MSTCSLPSTVNNIDPVKHEVNPNASSENSPYQRKAQLIEGALQQVGMGKYQVSQSPFLALALVRF
jgi:hypothetical protein